MVIINFLKEVIEFGMKKRFVFMALMTIIVFREVLEAALIIGIIATAMRGMPHRARWILIDIFSGRQAIRYNATWLLGASQAAFDHTLRLQVEYEF